MNDSPLGPFRDEEERQRVMSLVQGLSARNRMGKIARKLLHDDEPAQAEWDYLLRRLRWFMGWNSRAPRLALWCLGRPISDSIIQEEAWETLRNLVQHGQAKVNHVPPVVVRVVLPVITSYIIAIVMAEYMALRDSRPTDAQFIFAAVLIIPIVLLAFPGWLLAIGFNVISRGVEMRLREAAAEQLARVPDHRIVDPFLTALHADSVELRELSDRALGRELERMIRAERTQLVAHRVDDIRNSLHLVGAETCESMIKVIGIEGQPRHLPILRKMVTGRKELSVEVVREATLRIELRAKLAKDQALLLRPADQAEDHLLRPATATATPEEQLLRPLEGEA